MAFYFPQKDLIGLSKITIPLKTLPYTGLLPIYLYPTPYTYHQRYDNPAGMTYMTVL